MKLLSRSHSLAERRAIAIATATTIALGGAAVYKELKSSDEARPVINTTTANFKQTTVKPGDTLFSIGARAEPNVDPRITSTLIANTIALEKGITPEQATDITPGEVVPLPDNSQIGQEVEVIYYGKK